MFSDPAIWILLILLTEINLSIQLVEIFVLSVNKNTWQLSSQMTSQSFQKTAYEIEECLRNKLKKQLRYTLKTQNMFPVGQF